jgi:hypothetical protein
MDHRVLSLVVTSSLALGLSAPVLGGDTPDWLVNCGWEALLQRVGEADMPDGSGVVLSQVEVAATNGNYVPDANDSELDQPLYIRRSGGNSNPSSHATFVARKFFGLTSGLSRGVSYVYCFKATGWAQGDFLNVTTSAAPDIIPIIKVWNHSWIGSFGNATTDARVTRKLDFAITRDQDIVCVGLNNGSAQQPLLASSFNAIAVGRRDGDHSGGFWNGGDSDGRVRPDLVAPLYTVSEATPMVSGAASMLVQVAQDGGMGDDGEAPETIKAALMAGARKLDTGGEVWSNAPVGTGPDRGLSTQALDLNCGAGHMNIDRSHASLTGGRVMDGGSGAPAAWAHTDIAEGSTATYRFTTITVADEFNVVAAWNRTVTASDNYGTWWVADADLELFRVEDGSTVSLLGDGATDWVSGNVASRSTVGNIEHLHVTGLQPGTYELHVQMLDTGSDTSAKVALAWWTDAEGSTAIPGDINGDGVVNVSDLLMILEGWGPNPGHPADLDGNGVVDVNDLLAFLSLWVP